MDKILLVLLLLSLTILPGCKKKEVYKKPTTDDFETLMGKELPTWQYVQTKEDFENLHFFKTLYEGRKLFLKQPGPELKIPKVLHYIWIGPNPFPRASVENVRTWMAKHPDWKVKFWTDRERPLPYPGMELQLIRDFKFLELKDCYEKSDNYGEKSDVLRYEILYQEGGVYVDHDVKCFNTFDPFNHAYDFYCGMDMPFTSSLPSCVFPTNNLIGAISHHPILKTCMDALKEKWDTISRDYPGVDRDAMLNRVLHRTFLLFGEAIKTSANLESHRDIVFPAYYFDAPKDELALFARHLYSGRWFDSESKFEKMVRERLMILTKKTNKLFLFFGILSGLNLFGFIFLAIQLKRRHAAG